jgi:hypothetical protein
MERRASRPPGRTALVIAVAAVAACAVVGLGLLYDGRSILEHPLRAVFLLALTLLLQCLSIPVPGRGSIGVSAVGLIATGIALGVGAAAAVGVIAAVVQLVRTRGKLNRALFDASNFALGSAASAIVYAAVAGTGSGRLVQLGGAVAAAAVYCAVNHALLCSIMAVSELRSPLSIWHERFKWASFHFLAFGPLAFAAELLAVEVGAPILLAVAIPAVLVALSLRERLGTLTRRTPQPST